MSRAVCFYTARALVPYGRALVPYGFLCFLSGILRTKKQKMVKSSDDDRNSPEADSLSPTILYAKHPAMTGSLLLFGGDGAGKARF
jgi:hypothetical protein